MNKSPAKAIRLVITLAILCACVAYLSIRQSAQAEETRSPEERAVAFLAVEVPKWQRENQCFSCHNNGDAARALMVASKSGLLKDKQPLQETLAFLSHPERWDANGPEGPFKDKNLARIQFAAAWMQARDAKLVTDDRATEVAARLVAELQLSDGSWPEDAQGSVGSPVTYGPALSTWMAMQSLKGAGSQLFAEPWARSQAWFLRQKPQSVLDAAATLLALAESDSAAACEQRKRSLEIIKVGESPSGGWGPFVNSPPEVFDTAIVMLALAAQRRQEDLDAQLAAGRKFLIERQLTDGSWPPTTRPSGAESYAQQLSTTGWATQALLVTGERSMGK